MSMEEPLKETPKFDAYKEMKKIADEDSLAYFKKWTEVINLEQSANNSNSVSQFNSLSLGDKGTVKDQSLRMTEIEVDTENDNIIVTLERLYYANQKVQINNDSSAIKEHAHVNLLSVNQINFTKGLVVKKHLVEKKPEGSDEEMEDEQSENVLNKNEKKKVTYQKKKSTYIQYKVHFHLTNPRNFEKEALGGLDYKVMNWTIQLEVATTHMYNLMRNAVQLLCTQKEHFKRRKLIINQVEPQWESEAAMKQFIEDHENELEGLNETQKKTLAKSFMAKDYQMIIGVPGSGKTELIVRFMTIAKKLKMKVLLLNSNTQTTDNILLKLIEYQKQFKAEACVKFVKHTSSQHIEQQPGIKPFCHPCSKFQSVKELS